MISFEVKPLCRKIDGFVRTDGLRERKTFPTTSHCTFQCHSETAINPDRHIEVLAVLAFEKEDALENNHVDVIECVCVFAIACGGLFREVRCEDHPNTSGCGPVPVPTIGAAPLIFPHFAQDGGYQTSFTFNNLSNAAATITLSFYSQAGTLINSTTLAVVALGSARTAMVGTTLSVGWARASMSRPLTLPAPRQSSCSVRRGRW